MKEKLEESLEIIENYKDMFFDTLYENYRTDKVKCFEKSVEIVIENVKLLSSIISKEVIEKKIKYFKNKINDVDTKLYYLDDKLHPILQEILEENKNEN